MTGRLDGRVAIVTGAGRGLGRSHALALAQEGAMIMVNDLGVSAQGLSSSESPGEEVVAQIRSIGGRAILSTHDVADWSSAEAMVQTAVDQFGRLDILVNNAGILRDRSFANMSEQEWDEVFRVHVKGHAAPSRHAMAYWRDVSKAGERPKASIINTTSVAGLFPNFGQANYAAAKAAIAAFTQTLALEGLRYGIRINAVSPSARTRLVASVEGSDDSFDDADPQNVSPLIVWLATAGCSVNGQIYQLFGRRLAVCKLSGFAYRLEQTGRWTLAQMDELLPTRTVPLCTADEALAELCSRVEPVDKMELQQ